MRCLKEFAEKEGIGGAKVTAISALRQAKLAYFDWETKAYQRIEVGEQVEVRRSSVTSPSARMASPVFMRTRCLGAGTAAPWLAISMRPTAPDTGDHRH